MKLHRSKDNAHTLKTTAVIVEKLKTHKGYFNCIFTFIHIAKKSPDDSLTVYCAFGFFHSAKSPRMNDSGKFLKRHVKQYPVSYTKNIYHGKNDEELVSRNKIMR